MDIRPAPYGASLLENAQALKIQVHGVVQGVDSRPFVYRLAVTREAKVVQEPDVQG